MIDHDTASNVCFISSNIIAGNYGLNKTTLILVVAFLLSISISTVWDPHTVVDSQRIEQDQQ